MNMKLHEPLTASADDEARRAVFEKTLRDFRIVKWMAVALLIMVLWPIF